MINFEAIICKEDIDHYGAEIEMEKAINDIDLLFGLMIFEATENKSDSNNTDHFKNIICRIIAQIKDFIKKCKEYLKTSIDKLLARVKDAYTKHQLDNMLKDFDKAIKVAKEKGMETFVFIDYLKLIDALNDEMTAFKKLVSNFSYSYMRRANPEAAEKFIKMVEKISNEYDTKIEKILKNKRTYKIEDAKALSLFLKSCASADKNGYAEVLNEYYKVCDSVEKLAIRALDSLDEYSNETGYIQNAKTLKELLHNTSVKLKIHAYDSFRFTLNGIAIITSIWSFSTTDNTLVKSISAINIAGYGNDTIKRTDKITNKRSEDLTDWKFTKGESPLTFDRHNK